MPTCPNHRLGTTTLNPSRSQATKDLALRICMDNAKFFVACGSSE